MKNKNTKINALLCGCALFALAACEARPPDADDNEPARDLNADEYATSIAGLQKGLGGVNGDSDYCNNPAAPCESTTPPGNEGDCDNNAQCVGGAAPRCGKDNGPKFGSPAIFDFCWQAHCENGVVDGDEVGGVDCGGSCGACGVCGGMAGDADYCTSSCQCDAGDGDCDTDADCTAGNVCGVNNGAAFGLPPNYDVCWPATCENRVLDPGESGVDCGGPCVVSCAPGATSLQITEIQSNPTGIDEAEWIELRNPLGVAVDIGNWTLSDFNAAGEATTRWRFPPGTIVAANDVFVVTRYNDRFLPLFGFNADFELITGTRNDPNVPNLTPTTGTAQIILADVATGDAVILRDPGGVLIDGVEYGTQDRTVPGTPAPRPAEGSSLHRIANTGSSNTSFAVTASEGPGVFPNP